MGIWLELRCDEMSSLKCKSARNEGPMLMAPSTVKGVNKGLHRLHEEARKEGWAYTKQDGVYRWLCPECYGVSPTAGKGQRTPAASSPPPAPAR